MGSLDSGSRSRTGPYSAALLAVAGSAATTALFMDVLLRRQAGHARRIIGKPLGDEAPVTDRTYKKKYGNLLDLLVLGDSIAAGLGAESSKHTLAAHVAKRLARSTHRAVRVHTAACVGAESSMLRAQLADLTPGYRADVAIIVVGGNDVTHRVRTTVSQRHLAEAITVLRDQGTAVVVGTCPDLGALTTLPQPLRALARRASRHLAAAQRQTANELGAHAVTLADVVGPIFLARPDEMFALDRLHPSGAGYRRTAKALLPSVLAAIGIDQPLPHGHHPPLPSLPYPRGSH